ncbi:MAG: hypothetical protein K2H22_08105 [Muribaculaceae bacterium]|nr:hypothetical protein [Muribaculaceae bacterium]
MKKERIAGLVSAWKIGGAVLALLMVVGISSCGGSNDPNTVKLEVKPELGDLGNYMTIESKDAVISLSEFTDDGEPYVKLSSTLQVKVNKVVASNYGFDLDVVILDKNMNEITDFGDYDIENMSDYDFRDYHNYLPAGEHRAVMDETGSKKSWDGKASAMWELIRQNGKYMVLKPSYSSSKFVDYTGSTTGSSSSDLVEETEVETDELEVETVTVDSEDWNSVLDEYEKYCDKLVAAAKKAKADDVSVMAEYASLLESAESLQKKLENASSSLSVAQATRMNKIAAKMAQAMM